MHENELRELLAQIAQLREDPHVASLSLADQIDRVLLSLNFTEQQAEQAGTREMVLDAVRLLEVACGTGALDRARILEARLPGSLFAKQIRAELEKARR